MPQVKPSRKSAAAKKKSATAPSRSAKTAARTSGKPSPKLDKEHNPRRSGKDESAAGEREVTIDRRKPAAQQPPLGADGAPLERRKKVNRRRQIDPTTCERDYTDQEVEFMNAIDDYKRKNGRMFPTCSEVLEVVRSLGYVKMPISLTVVQSPPETFESSDSPELPASSL